MKLYEKLNAFKAIALHAGDDFGHTSREDFEKSKPFFISISNTELDTGQEVHCISYGHFISKKYVWYLIGNSIYKCKRYYSEIYPAGFMVSLFYLIFEKHINFN